MILKAPTMFDNYNSLQFFLFVVKIKHDPYDAAAEERPCHVF